MGLLALGEEREIFVTDLLDVEEATLGADVGLAEVVDAVDDGGADGARDAVVVCLADAADRRDVCFVEEVLGVVCTWGEWGRGRGEERSSGDEQRK